VQVDTEAQLVRSSSVIERATRSGPALAGADTGDVARRIAVTVAPNTTVLEISFRAASAAEAKAGADVLASAYLTDRATALRGRVAARVTSLQDRLSDLEGVRDEAGVLADELRRLRNDLLALDSTQVGAGRVISSASLPTNPSSPSRPIWMASGLGVGLALGALLAWARDQRPRRLRRQDEVERVLGVACVVARPRGRSSELDPTTMRRLAVILTSTVPESSCVLVTGRSGSTSGPAVASGLQDALTRAGTTTHGIGTEPDRVPASIDDLRQHQQSVDAALQRARGDAAVLVVRMDDPERVDVQEVAAVADAVVLVVDADAPTRVARSALRALDEVGAPLLNVVLVGAGGGPETRAVPVPGQGASLKHRARSGAAESR
jgi:capsular polysaccharide biosynthesis protein